jgi:EmrB/QacA subfamily drug resistance transporter
MSAEDVTPSPVFRLRDLILRGSEPPPAEFVARLRCYPWLVVGVTCIGAFIGQLDASIVQLALPTLGRIFDTSLESISWVSLGYLLAFASFLPIFGQLCEIFGRKLLYLTGFLLFAGASALCGLAPDLTSLVAFRVLQGIGGAMLGANSMSVLIKAIDQSRRVRALGVFSAAQAIGVSAGPAVGGLLIGTLGWPSVFWVAVPFALAAVIIGWLVLPRTDPQDQDQVFDWRGALLLAPALTLVVLVLNQVSALGPTSLVLIACTGTAIVLLIVFVRQEHASASPLVDLRMLGRPAFLGGIVACALGYALLYGMFFLTSFALVSGYHDSPTLAGLKLAVIPVAIGIVAPFSGDLSKRLGPRLLSVAAMAVCVTALLVLSAISTEPSNILWIDFVGLAGFGAGLGLFIAPNNYATINAAPSNRSGEAGAMLNLMRVLGTSLGIASASSMLSWQMQVVSGTNNRRLALFSEHHLMEAVQSGMLMLAVFAVIAGGISMIRKTAAA